MARQDGSVRFAAIAEKSADVAVKRLDTNFIDQLGRTTGYLMQLFVFGVAAWDWVQSQPWAICANASPAAASRRRPAPVADPPV